MEPTEPGNSSIEELVNGISSKKALAAFGSSILGLTIDTEKLTAPQIRDELIKIYNKQAEEIEASNIKEAKRMASDEDPIIRFKFLNLENPGAFHEFASDGGRGLKATPEGITGKIPTYKFFHGKVHTAPLSIMKMLNALAVPFTRYETHEETGEVLGKVSGTKPRFSCQIELTDEQIKTFAS